MHLMSGSAFGATVVVVVVSTTVVAGASVVGADVSGVVSGVVSCVLLDVETAEGVSLIAQAASASERTQKSRERRTKHESVCMHQA
jgi:mannitol-specific phosphotransferase system IIBC component